MTDEHRAKVQAAFAVLVVIGIVCGWTILNAWVLFTQWAVDACVPVGFC